MAAAIWKALSTGDDHFDQHSRLAECIRVHGWMVELAERERIDAFLDGGDIYERGSTPEERQAVAEWLTAMADVAPVVIAKGNHDRPRDVELMRRLRTRHPVIVESAAAVHRVAGASIATVAWPERAQLLSTLGNVSAEVADDAATQALRAVLLGLGHQMDEHEGPRVLLGHFMADGSITSTGQPLIGQSMRVGLTDLALARPHIGLMSHIHLAQRFEWDGVPYHYMGSSHRTDYGQLERKTVLLSTFEGDQLVEVREIETPCARMFHVVDEYGLLDSSDHRTWLVGLGGEPADREHYRGAEVRFRYRVAADYREEAKARAHGEIAEYFREHGVADLKIEEEVIGKSAARAPEVALASSLPDKLRALWKRRNETLAPEREQSLIDMASELEAEEAA